MCVQVEKDREILFQWQFFSITPSSTNRKKIRCNVIARMTNDAKNNRRDLQNKIKYSAIKY